MTEHLSCDPCRRTKTRCTKDKPTCSKCRTADLDCTYSARKKRRPKNRKPLDKLLERLDKLEHHLSSAAPLDATPPSRVLSGEIDDFTRQSDSLTGHQVHHEASSLPTLETPIVSTPNFSLPTPESNAGFGTTGSSPAAHGQSKSMSDLPTEVARNWLAKVINYAGFRAYLGLVDHDVLQSMPASMNSPLVSFDPSLEIIYLCLIFQAWTFFDDDFDSPDWGRVMYQRTQRITPDWLKRDEVTGVDFTAAFLLNFDVNTAWWAHSQACQLAIRMGLPDYESSAAVKVDSPEVADSKRVMFWQLLSQEGLIRVFFQKPALVTHKSWQVNLPAGFVAAMEETSEACMATSLLVSSRLNLLILDTFNSLEDESLTMGQMRDIVTKCITGIEAVLTDWKIDESIANAADHMDRWIFAEAHIYAHSLIVFWERKLAGLTHTHPSPRAVTSSRAVLSGINAVACMDKPAQRSPGQYSAAVTLISFYPMLAYFNLFDMILLDGDGNTSDSDMTLLKNFAHVLREGVRVRGLDNVVPFAESILQMAKAGRSTSMQASGIE